MVTLGLKLAPGQPNNFCTNSERRAGAYRALLGWLRTHKAARVLFVPHGVAFAHVVARSSGTPPLITRKRRSPRTSRCPLPAERHNKKLMFPSNYTHGFGPAVQTLIGFPAFR